VLGLAATGHAVARVLADRGAEVLASELGSLPAKDVEDLAAAGVEIETAGHDIARSRLRTFDFVVPSPGISPHTEILSEVASAEVPIVTELDLGARLTEAPVVAVTGTNGKTTVCRLAERIARASGRRAFACGNLEVKFLTAAAEHPDADLFVVEAPSFVLEFTRVFRPRVAVVTNIAPNHLDWHGSFERYRAAKGRIAARQHPDDLFLYPIAQPEIASLAPDGGPKRVGFSSVPDESAGAWVEGDEVVVRTDGPLVRAKGAGRLAERAPHFAEDAAAAAAALVFFGAQAEAVERGMASFTLDPHRLEPVGTLDGVRVVDDSKATTPHATVAALRTFERVVLIAGGRNRAGDLRALAGESGRIRTVVALGEAAGELADVFDGTGVSVKNVGSMTEAVAVALGEASRGDVVLLSPACASLDMYSSYVERGRAFREACLKLGVRGTEATE
jgi:UDP-N-acetylmuramoylalanine--D-glutamate ligase